MRALNVIAALISAAALVGGTAAAAAGSTPPPTFPQELAAMVKANPDLPALVRRIGTGTGTEADRTRLLQFPALASRVIEPGEGTTQATMEETPTPGTASGSQSAARDTGNGNYTNAITITSTYKSLTGSTIYRWQHAISVNRNGTNVTSLNYRKEIIPERQAQIVVRDFWVNNNSGMGTTRYQSELGRTLEACLPVPVGCYATYQPRSEIYAYGNGYYSWNADAA